MPRTARLVQLLSTTGATTTNAIGATNATDGAETGAYSCMTPFASISTSWICYGIIGEL